AGRPGHIPHAELRPLRAECRARAPTARRAADPARRRHHGARGTSRHQSRDVSRAMARPGWIAVLGAAGAAAGAAAVAAALILALLPAPARSAGPPFPPPVTGQ